MYVHCIPIAIRYIVLHVVKLCVKWAVKGILRSFNTYAVNWSIGFKCRFSLPSFDSFGVFFFFFLVFSMSHRIDFEILMMRRVNVRFRMHHFIKPHLGVLCCLFFFRSRIARMSCNMDLGLNWRVYLISIPVWNVDQISCE